MEDLSTQKTRWRKLLLEKRKKIPEERRRQASSLILEALKNRGALLSFSPMGSEIDISSLNAHLATKGRLYLVPYDLNSFNNVPLEKIDWILVPALGFDREGYRIGYGKGYYDRFLANTDTPTIGVGFLEQLSQEPIPKEPWDIPVQELLLV
ncbi:MAG: hypothetical protein ACD_17C00374G0003 [uncultured bacterium]|nr:MAG: hypothetical protein ACD_17C00374G0003 [uncultured bacterium]OGN56643.1 MAG: 5-formyltetrahydrofolate cyclo-ligase [Chlamydiae bacterium RIFCSPHIGHO2_01_FULL_44_39]OGN57520.1 MAG: 5-formyltetrahydrofolate cyclo-ligase [Chlamydiae bacterium RIFCSPHIGHO2_02_FULL_45_9]OGN61151.1 MAG: 5-formyltetrahydrofolate cyclo-ligase [Chlamydiae bacterium RIFCSPHIGHO2_12_FULL_44_59]OGN65621.1 MAG: 5-formyltetrahydrofolate cyclo-ligase [Chlamydiae bacterium RIFCSPLOWO2_01_FULL_44_52]OGN68098.1 MAG: 5-f